MSSFFSYVSSFFWNTDETVDPVRDISQEDPPEVLTTDGKILRKDFARRLTIELFKMISSNAEESDIRSFLDKHPIRSLLYMSYNSCGLNLLMMSIVYNSEIVFNEFINEKIFTPDQLRSMKNSNGYNLITLCRYFDRVDFASRIRNYVSEYETNNA